MGNGRIAAPAASAGAPTAWLVIVAISLCHLLNDVMQSLLAAIYPLLQVEFALAFWQIGLMTFAYQVTASILQPLVGWLGDRRHMPTALPLAWHRRWRGCCCWPERPHIRCCWPALR